MNFFSNHQFEFQPTIFLKNQIFKECQNIEISKKNSNFGNFFISKIIFSKINSPLYYYDWQEDEEWPDLQQCRKLGLHFDTGHMSEPTPQTAKKPPKSLITVGLAVNSSL